MEKVWGGRRNHIYIIWNIQTQLSLAEWGKLSPTTATSSSWEKWVNVFLHEFRELLPILYISCFVLKINKWPLFSQTFCKETIFEYIILVLVPQYIQYFRISCHLFCLKCRSLFNNKNQHNSFSQNIVN